MPCSFQVSRFVDCGIEHASFRFGELGLNFSILEFGISVCGIREEGCRVEFWEPWAARRAI
jgi:hypothetical protein